MKQKIVLDNRTSYDTPEGIPLSLMPAGIVVRVQAFIIDAIARVLIILLVLLPFMMLGQTGTGLLALVWFGVVWLYPVLFEVYYHGQTLGKKMMGIYVCMEDGAPIGWQGSMMRNLLLLADFLPFAFAFGVLSLLFTKDSKRLGDLVAGTQVVYIEKLATFATLDTLDVKPIIAPIALTTKEQLAILAFAERFDDLPSARAEELSDIVAPLTQDESIATLLGYAKSIHGGENG